MKERPILFSGPMVRALLAGTKTQTRRVVKIQPCGGMIVVGWYHPTVVDRHGDDQPGREIFGAYDDSGEWGMKCPYGAPGERMWVREAWRRIGDAPDSECTGPHCAMFRASADEVERAIFTWKPSIHMPRWASRILLEIAAVRVEQLQDISEDDARAEGAPLWDPTLGKAVEVNKRTYGGSFKAGYAELWEEINGAGSWAANPWVWVVEFKRAAP